MLRKFSGDSLVSVVIPTHNRRESLKRLIDSVLSSDYQKLEVIVVDDASVGNTLRDVVKDGHGKVRLIRNEKETLLASSRNAGIRTAYGDLIFLIDDDNVIAQDTISALVRVMHANSTVGVAGPLMYYLGDPARVWCGRVQRDYVTSRTVFPEKGKVDLKLNEIMESDDFPNAFMVRHSVLGKVGLFDGLNFPINYDEADFCSRVRQAGFRVVLVPSARVWHDTPLPSKAVSGARLFGVHNNERAFYMARNRILFHRKYSKPEEFLLFAALFLPLVSCVYLKTILVDPNLPLARRLSISLSYIRGTVHGLRTRI